jgi:hypothetical protein
VGWRAQEAAREDKAPAPARAERRRPGPRQPGRPRPPRRPQIGAFLARYVFRASWAAISRFYGLCLLTDQVGAGREGAGASGWLRVLRVVRARCAQGRRPRPRPYCLPPPPRARPQVHMNDRAGELLLAELQPFINDILASPRQEAAL